MIVDVATAWELRVEEQDPRTEARPRKKRRRFDGREKDMWADGILTRMDVDASRESESYLVLF